MIEQDKNKIIGNIDAETIVKAAKQGTPVYIYDESTIIKRCNEVMNMPNAFGIAPRYAMKANSNKAILQIVSKEGLNIDASSMNEVRRANMAGIDYSKIMLTTQEVPKEKDRDDLEEMILQGLRYNVCSMRQLHYVSDFASENKIPLSMRVHPGVGSGESATRNTGDKYSCFGIHLSDIDSALIFAECKNLIFDQVHVHIGSGGDPLKWRENIERELGFVERYFPDADKISFGGGLKVARMPEENFADLEDLGNYAKEKINDFYEKTGKKLKMEIEPGTYIAANAGLLVTKVLDKKKTGKDGFNFIVLDGGMEVNARPLLYGSEHPFYVISRIGKLMSSEFDLNDLDNKRDRNIIVGRCCESGDSQSLDEEGHILERVMANPDHDDYVVIGGCGAYCSSMSPFNYNSHVQAPEILVRTDGSMHTIRKEQTLDQMTQNEYGIQ